MVVAVAVQPGRAPAASRRFSAASRFSNWSGCPLADLETLGELSRGHGGLPPRWRRRRSDLPPWRCTASVEGIVKRFLEAPPHRGRRPLRRTCLGRLAVPEPRRVSLACVRHLPAFPGGGTAPPDHRGGSPGLAVAALERRPHRGRPTHVPYPDPAERSRVGRVHRRESRARRWQHRSPPAPRARVSDG